LNNRAQHWFHRGWVNSGAIDIALATVSAHLSRPERRLALAALLSLLVHGWVLWMPEIHLPRHERELPPLIARLEPLPKMSAKVAPKAKPKPKVRPKPQPESALKAPAELPIIASAPVPASAPLADETGLAAASSPEPASAPVAAEPEPEASPQQPQRAPLPKHAKLRFNVYKGEGGIKLGESVNTLEISDGRYTLKAEVQTTGLVGVFKTYRLTQTSTGTATERTLQPEVFSEEVNNSGDKKINRAELDWANHTIRFSNGGEAKLTDRAQDILSILYQFPPMDRRMEIVTINIATGKQFEEYRFEIAFEEQLETAMGNLQTVHFRKLHGAHEEGLEIWFAQEYRMLPVKVRHLDRDGKISGEAIITDIRVSDE
jgi:hypothetical protein